MEWENYESSTKIESEQPMQSSNNLLASNCVLFDKMDYSPFVSAANWLCLCKKSISQRFESTIWRQYKIRLVQGPVCLAESNSEKAHSKTYRHVDSGLTVCGQCQLTVQRRPPWIFILLRQHDLLCNTKEPAVILGHVGFRRAANWMWRGREGYVRGQAVI